MAQLSSSQQQIIAILEEKGSACTPKELATLTGIQNIRMPLRRMEEKGLIIQQAYGLYMLPLPQEMTPVPESNQSNKSNTSPQTRTTHTQPEKTHTYQPPQHLFSLASHEPLVKEHLPSNILIQPTQKSRKDIAPTYFVRSGKVFSGKPSEDFPETTTQEFQTRIIDALPTRPTKHSRSTQKVHPSQEQETPVSFPFKTAPISCSIEKLISQWIDEQGTCFLCKNPLSLTVYHTSFMRCFIPLCSQCYQQHRQELESNPYIPPTIYPLLPNKNQKKKNLLDKRGMPTTTVQCIGEDDDYADDEDYLIGDEENDN